MYSLPLFLVYGAIASALAAEFGFHKSGSPQVPLPLEDTISIALNGGGDPSRLYAVDGDHEVWRISNLEPHAEPVSELPSGHWYAVDIAPCDDDKSCAYFLRKEATTTWSLHKFEEHTGNTLKNPQVSNFEIAADLAIVDMIIDETGDVWLIGKELDTLDKLHIFQIDSSNTGKSVISHEPLSWWDSDSHASIDLSADGLHVLISSSGILYRMERKKGESIHHLLQNKKPHHLPWHGKTYYATVACWDIGMSGYFVVGENERDAVLYRYERAQADEAITNGYPTSKNAQKETNCEDKNSYCDQWSNIGMCKKENYIDYMDKNCPRSCNSCEKMMRKTVANTGCTDTHHMCAKWAKHGRCTQTYMHQNCKKSCDMCDQKLTCQDGYQQCMAWSSAGHCQSNKAFMTRSCPASCKFCSSECNDKIQYCSSWAEHNKCETRKTFMHANCPNSCKLCGGEALASETKCTNENKYCTIWAKHGMCFLKPGYMGNNCRLACKTCRSNEIIAGCEDTDDSCEYWAGHGMCESRPDFMHENCAHSCDACQMDTEQNEKCEDLNEKCATWASGGYCDTSVQYMKQSCPTSCGFCTSTADQKGISQICQDKDSNCKMWASRNYCTKNSSKSFMERSCMASCSLCKANLQQDEAESRDYTTHRQHGAASAEEDDTCKDLGSHCDAWMKAGLCEKESDWMHKNCAKSCEQCIPNSSGEKKVEAHRCTDKHNRCSVWAGEGKCESAKEFMSQMCKKSCDEYC